MASITEAFIEVEKLFRKLDATPRFYHTNS